MRCRFVDWLRLNEQSNLLLATDRHHLIRWEAQSRSLHSKPRRQSLTQKKLQLEKKLEKVVNAPTAEALATPRDAEMVPNNLVVPPSTAALANVQKAVLELPVSSSQHAALVTREASGGELAKRIE